MLQLEPVLTDGYGNSVLLSEDDTLHIRGTVHLKAYAAQHETVTGRSSVHLSPKEATLLIKRLRELPGESKEMVPEQDEYETQRGFHGYAQFACEAYNVRVQQSSSVAPHCWIFVEGPVRVIADAEPYAGIPWIADAEARISVPGPQREVLCQALLDWLDDLNG